MNHINELKWKNNQKGSFPSTISSINESLNILLPRGGGPDKKKDKMSQKNESIYFALIKNVFREARISVL